MTPNTKKQIWEALQAEMQTPGFTGEFDKFKRAYPKLRQFDTPQELVEFFTNNEILHCVQNDRQKIQNDEKIQLREQVFHSIVSKYQADPKAESWLMRLLLLISWKQMGKTFYRFGERQLRFISPYDSFAPVYGSYVEAFLDVKQKETSKICLHIKDRAEYLIKKELKESGRVKGEPVKEVLSFDCLPFRNRKFSC